MAKPLIPSKLIKAILILLDNLGLLVCFNVAYYIRLSEFPSHFLFSINFMWVVALVLGVSYIFDLYDPESQISGLRAPARFLLATAIAGTAIAVLLYLIGGLAKDQFGRGVMAGALTVFAIWGATWRVVIAKWLKRRGKNIRWLFVGDSNYILQFQEDYNASELEGQVYYLHKPGENAENLKGLKVLGDWDQLRESLRKGWSGIVVGAEGRLSEEIIEALLEVRLKGTRVYNLSDFYEMIWYKVPVYFLDRTWLVLSQGFVLLHNPIGLRIKRVCDVIGAVVMILLLAPLMLLVYLAVFLQGRGPVIFEQIRTGKEGKNFVLYKFRTMKVNAEEGGAQWSTQNDDRITRLGRLLRKMRVDELPQLWNVLRGEMSFIGPRPERPVFDRDLAKKIPHYNLRTVVRPGITGWAQVLYQYGSSEKDAREKLQYDLYYIKNYSLLMDIAIVFKTVRAILLGAGR